MPSINNKVPLIYEIKLCASFQIHWWIQTGGIVWKRIIQVKIGDYLSPVTSRICWITLKNNRAPLLYCIKLCAVFQNHWYIQTGVRVRKHSILVKIGNFLSEETLKIYGWPWKTIGHLSYAASSFVLYFESIGEVKLELQSGNAQFRSKLTIFCPALPCNLMDDLEKQ